MLATKGKGVLVVGSAMVNSGIFVLLGGLLVGGLELVFGRLVPGKICGRLVAMLGY